MPSLRTAEDVALKNWYRQATVRAAPRRVLDDPGSTGLYFSRALVPELSDPRLQAFGEEAARDVLTQTLYAYLDFTAMLEHKVVNEVAAQIAAREVRVSLESEARYDAYKLYCDEAYHALAAADMQAQVERASGLAPVFDEPPSFLAELDGFLQPLDHDDTELARLLFAVVSETLISGTLKHIPRDASVVTGIREVVFDHALDEAHHHTYFSALFEHVWRQFPESTRLELGTLLGPFVLLFLRPDRRRKSRILLNLGLPEPTVESILADAYPEMAVTRSARHTARATMSLFARTGVTDVPEIRAAFVGAGLLDARPRVAGASARRQT